MHSPRTLRPRRPVRPCRRQDAIQLVRSISDGCEFYQPFLVKIRTIVGIRSLMAALDAPSNPPLGLCVRGRFDRLVTERSYALKCLYIEAKFARKTLSSFFPSLPLSTCPDRMPFDASVQQGLPGAAGPPLAWPRAASSPSSIDVAKPGSVAGNPGRRGRFCSGRLRWPRFEGSAGVKPLSLGCVCCPHSGRRSASAGTPGFRLNFSVATSRSSDCQMPSLFSKDYPLPGQRPCTDSSPLLVPSSWRCCFLSPRPLRGERPTRSDRPEPRGRSTWCRPSWRSAAT